MTRVCCPTCRLRLTPADAAILAICPECRRELRAVDSSEGLVGYRLFHPGDAPPALPVAAEMALPTDFDQDDPR